MKSRSQQLVLALAATLLVTSPAFAQGDDVAMAQSLFERGRELMKEGKNAEACEKFAESNRLDASAGTLLNLGQCQEALGKTASAWASYNQAIVLARAKGQARHETAGQEYLAAIEPKLSKLQVDAPNPVAGLVIRRDEVEMGAGVLGVPLAVDPGRYVVRASAPGRKAWETTVEIGDNADFKTISIPDLELADPEDDEPVIVPPPDDPTDQDGAVPPGDDASGQRMVGFVVGGVGVAAVAVGSVFGILTLSAASDAEANDDLCPDKKCSDAGLDQIDGAETKAWVANIAIGAGAIAIAAGVVLVLTAGDGAPASTVGAKTSRAGSVWLAPAASPFGGGAIVGGAF